MVKRKRVSFLAKKPVKKTISFKARGRTVKFKAKVPKRVKVSFLARRKNK